MADKPASDLKQRFCRLGFRVQDWGLRVSSLGIRGNFHFCLFFFSHLPNLSRTLIKSGLGQGIGLNEGSWDLLGGSFYL